MAYDILHKHGRYMRGEKQTYIKLNGRPFLTKRAAIAKSKTYTGEDYLIVPHGKVKAHPMSKTDRSFRGLYYIKK